MRYVGLSSSTRQLLAKLLAGEVVEAYRLAQWSIDLVGSDPVEGQDRNFRFTTGSVVVLSRAGRMQLGPPELAQRHAKRHRHAALCRRDTGVVLLSLISSAYPSAC